jgi:SAM-dependent methyltransferase
MTESGRPVAAGSGEGGDANAIYALGSSQGESARLQRQADELAPDSAALLDRVGLRPGQSAIDLGCGPRGILDLLAGRVSPGGRVVGLDANPAHTAMAVKFVSDQALTGVEIVTADARHTGLPPASFDVAHARTLLINLPDPAPVVAEMLRLAGPGGWVAVAEPDTEHALCYPPSRAFDRICEIFPVVLSRNGADPAIGRRVPELFRQAGLAELTAESRTQMYPPGTRAGRCGSTWYAPCARRSRKWDWPARRSLTSWTRRPAPTSRTLARSSCLACCSWSGAAGHDRVQWRTGGPRAGPGPAARQLPAL